MSRPHLLPPAAVLALLASASSVVAEEPTGADPQREPRLVVIVSLEQLLPDQLERLGPWLQGGLARFLRQGQRWEAAELRHAVTDAAPGMATIATGLSPARHGVVADGFHDREAGSWRYATHDPDVLLFAPGGVLTEAIRGGDSPRFLLAPGLGDHLRATAPDSRAVSVGGDARAAVLLGGQRPTLSLWWDRRAGGFTSSSWYAAELPAWVREWNRGWAALADGHVWEPLVPGPLLGAGFRAAPLDGEAASPAGAQLPIEFPHLGPAAAPVEHQALAALTLASPLIDRFTIDLALRAVAELELGARDAVDLLCVTLSACDAVGHLSGPYGRALADVILRADRELERLFAALDAQVGEGRWIAALCSASGVLELPEALRERGVGAHRLYSFETRRTLAVVRERLSERYGSFFGANLPGTVLLLDAAELARVGADPTEVRALARDALVEAGRWAAGAYTWDELAGLDGDEGDPWLALYRSSYHPARAPDLAVRLQPWTVLNRRMGTDHGSPYPYDRRIALAFLGPGFAAGASWEPAGAIDLLPTLLHRLGIPLPEGLEGRVLGTGGD